MSGRTRGFIGSRAAGRRTGGGGTVRAGVGIAAASASAIVAVALAAPRVVEAQQVGTVTGRVTDRDTRQPLAATQVVVVGAGGRGAAADDNGVYRIPGIAAGQVTLRVRRIGYQGLDTVVTVRGGEVTTLNLILGRSAATLEQVTVTATGDVQRKREIGASISRLDTSAFNPAVVQNFSQTLAARAPGVTVQAPGGTTGTGSRIRLRAPSSLSLSNDPLLIVDGVLMNNNSSGLTIGIGNQQVSRFDDINPEDIESIEVIKGPAATALFGTGAGNGVIQITTKRGRAGRPRWSAYAEGANQYSLVDVRDPLQTLNYRAIGRSAAGARVNCSIESQALARAGVAGQCATLDTLYTNSPLANISPFRNGTAQQYGLNVSGGSADARYYLGAETENTLGIFDPNWQRRVNTRSNVTANVLKSLVVDASIGYLDSRTGLPLGDNLFAGTLSAGLLGGAFDCSPTSWRTIRECQVGNDSLSRGYVTANVPVTQYFAQRQQQDIQRLLTGVTATWTPLSWLKGIGRVNGDFLQRFDQSLTPPNRVFQSLATVEGSRVNTRSYIPTITSTGSLSASWRRFGVNGTTTAGGQYQMEQLRRTDATGAVLLPGTASLNGASARFTVNEFNTRVVTIGGFLEQRLELADRFFLTGGLRADDASVFGNQSGGWVYYPFVNTSYVVSEEGWFPKADWLSSLRLRGAYGRSSQRPGFRQAQTFFDRQSVNLASAVDNQPAATVGGPVGNSLLRPEITSEWEGGTELALFSNRVTFDVTGYRRSTRDMLVSRDLAPSLGVANNQFVNLSQMSTRGLEASVTAQLLQLRNFAFNQSVNFHTFGQRIDALGLDAQGKPLPPIIFGANSTQQFRAGYAPGGFFQRRILSYADLNGDGLISRINCPTYGGVSNPQVTGGPRCEVVLSDSVEYLGSPLPTREWNFNSTFTVFRQFTVNALLNYRGGVRMFNQTREFRNNGGFANGPDFWDRNAPLADQVRSVARSMGSSDGYIEDASFVRLQELALTWQMPQALVRRTRTQGVAFTFGGRNLALWSDYSGFDPEVISQSGSNWNTFDFLTNPPTRRWTGRVTVTF